MADPGEASAFLPAAVPIPRRGERAAALLRTRPQARLRGQLDLGQIQGHDQYENVMGVMAIIIIQ